MVNKFKIVKDMKLPYQSTIGLEPTQICTMTIQVIVRIFCEEKNAYN